MCGIGDEILARRSSRGSWVSEHCTGAYKHLAAVEMPTSTLLVIGIEGEREEKSEARRAG